MDGDVRSNNNESWARGSIANGGWNCSGDQPARKDMAVPMCQAHRDGIVVGAPMGIEYGVGWINQDNGIGGGQVGIK